MKRDRERERESSPPFFKSWKHLTLRRIKHVAVFSPRVSPYLVDVGRSAGEARRASNTLRLITLGLFPPIFARVPPFTYLSGPSISPTILVSPPHPSFAPLTVSGYDSILSVALRLL